MWKSLGAGELLSQESIQFGVAIWTGTTGEQTVLLRSSSAMPSRVPRPDLKAELHSP